MEDGIVQEYADCENSTGVGDKLIFKILVPKDTQERRQITLHLKDANDRILTWGYIFKPEVKRVFGLKVDSIGASDDSRHSENIITEDFMHWNWGKVSLYRYFRTEYSLMWQEVL